MRIPTPPIITTDVWGAQPPTGAITPTGRPGRIIFHHTAGHHPEIENPRDESRAEAIRYARDIQHFHMHTNGWLDSGHNFLVCRNGLILVGRHFSYTQVRAGRMVISAHCPGQNDQVGIEHEHLHEQSMSAAQLESSARLCAWIIDRCGMRATGTIRPHGDFFPTSCPGELRDDIPLLVRRVVALLNAARGV